MKGTNKLTLIFNIRLLYCLTVYFVDFCTWSKKFVVQRPFRQVFCWQEKMSRCRSYVICDRMVPTRRVELCNLVKSSQRYLRIECYSRDILGSRGLYFLNIPSVFQEPARAQFRGGNIAAL